MDHEVGRLLGALDALGSSVRDTTAVVLHADHVRSTFDFSLPHGSDDAGVGLGEGHTCRNPQVLATRVYAYCGKQVG